MSFELTGTIYKLEPVTSRESGGKTYKSQDIILSCPEEYNGKTYDNHPKLTGKTDKVLQYMAGLKEGQKVTVHFKIKGFNGARGNFTGLEVWKIDTQAGQPHQSQPAPSYADTRQSTSPGTGKVFNPSPSTEDDLPF